MKDVTSSRAGSDGGFRESGLRPEDLAWGVPAPPRSYWPARIAVLVAMALYLVLPDRLVPGPRVIVPALEAVVLVAITVLVPHRTTVAAPARRVLAILIIGLVTLANIINLALLLAQLLKGTVQNGRELVVSSVAIWLTNAIAFGLWYWELDRGGPTSATSRRTVSRISSSRRWPHRERPDPTGHRASSTTST